jgi:hypothetical protein
MRTAATAAGALLCVAIAAGTVSDRASIDPPLTIDGYRVLAADFHVHPAIVSAAAIAPWDLVLDAQRQKLDALAITPHNAVFDARIARWFSSLSGGPTVLVGEEVRAPSYHLIAIGIDRPVSWHQSARAAIDEVHRQGGIAIAAHPQARYWPAYDDEALAALDGAEIMHPLALEKERARREFQQFFARRRLTAIGSSDFHGPGRLGMCRTYVFAADAGEQAILSALRAGRTVVYDVDGRAYGDPALVRSAEKDGRLPGRERERYAALMHPDESVLATFSRVAGVMSLFATTLLVFNRRER